MRHSKVHLRIYLEPQTHRADRKVHLCVRRRRHAFVGAVNPKVIGQLKTVPIDVESGSTIGCWDTEDVEDWLVEEGIGYIKHGIFWYGITPDEVDYDPGAPDSVDDES